jgi:hypothetical protein
MFSRDMGSLHPLTSRVNPRIVSNRRMRKTARPVVWEPRRAQHPAEATRYFRDASGVRSLNDPKKSGIFVPFQLSKTVSVRAP